MPRLRDLTFYVAFATTALLVVRDYRQVANAQTIQAPGKVPPSLIMEFSGGGSGSLFSSSLPQLSDGVVFTLEYDPYDGTLPTTKPFGIRAAIEIGDAAGMFMPGQTGTFDFNETNSADFDAFVARLTNGVNEDLYAANEIPRPDGNYPFGGASRCTEGCRNHSNRDLIGVQIAFVRLIVKSVSLQHADGSLRYSTDAVWQVWGTVPGQQPPIANAGPDQIIPGFPGTNVQLHLDGSGSYDPNNDPIDFSWAGPFVDFLGQPATLHGPNPIVTLAPGRYTIVLTVRDDRGSSASDEVVIDIRDTVGDLTAQLDQARADLAAAVQHVADLQRKLDSANQQLTVAHTTIAAQTNEIAAQAGQIALLQRTVDVQNAAMSGDVARVELDFRATFGDPTFAIRGASPVEQLRALVDAVVKLNTGRKGGLYTLLR